jgi:hypothetical protein
VHSDFPNALYFVDQVRGKRSKKSGWVIWLTRLSIGMSFPRRMPEYHLKTGRKYFLSDPYFIAVGNHVPLYIILI